MKHDEGQARERLRRDLDAGIEALRGLEARLEIEAPPNVSPDPSRETLEEKAEFRRWMSVRYSIRAQLNPPEQALFPGLSGLSTGLSLGLTTVFQRKDLASSSSLCPVDKDESSWKGLASLVTRGIRLGGRFLVLDLLARGGMGLVFRGIDLKRRPVAIKMVPRSAGDRTRRSLEIIRRLSHPAIVSIEHVGSLEDEWLFVVMPYLEGWTLQSLLRPPAGPLEGLLLAYRRACEGVAHAHAQGVVHADLKPANIQVEPEGRAVVLDWQMACLSGSQAGPEGPVLGTPLYMAPEQVGGRPLTPRTDIYALGIVLYELLTGVNPAGPGDSLANVFRRIRKENPPPPSALRKDLPPGLDSIVLRCLAKDPEARFGNAGELLEELEGLPI